MRSVVDDLGAELVAHHDVAFEIHDERAARAPRPFDQFLGMLERVQVGAADSAGERLDQRLAGARRGRCDIVDHEFLVTHHGCAHDVILQGLNGFPIRSEAFYHLGEDRG